MDFSSLVKWGMIKWDNIIMTMDDNDESLEDQRM